MIKFLHSIVHGSEWSFDTKFDFGVVGAVPGDQLVVEIPRAWRAIPPPGWKRREGTHSGAEQFIFQVYTPGISVVTFKHTEIVPQTICPAAVITRVGNV